jgi:hypothetical protein
MQSFLQVFFTFTQRTFEPEKTALAKAFKPEKPVF